MAHGHQEGDVGLQKEKYHGEAGFVDPEKIENIRKAACRVVTKIGAKQSAGSGVLVDGRSLGFPHACLLTNQHVIETRDQAASSTIYFNYKNNDDTTWLKAKLDPGHGFAAHEDSKLGLDFCLVALKTDPSLPRLETPRTLDDVINDKTLPHCPAPVSLDPEAAMKEGSIITIWQHPGHGFKKFTSCKVLSVTKTTLAYKNRTEKGSSGSPIYNRNGDLVGIHYAGGTLRKP